MRIFPVNSFGNNNRVNANYAPNLGFSAPVSYANSLPFDTVSFTQKHKGEYDKRSIEWTYLTSDEISIPKARPAVKRLNFHVINGLPQTEELRETAPKSFEESDKKFTLDKYQKEAVQSFRNGNTTIVTAPTGTGKTLIAEYAMDDALKKGKRIIYLSPLKALSNEKFVKFNQLFGEYDEHGELVDSDNVGLITGDTVINADAKIVIMTTEVYRNKLNTNDEYEIEEFLRDVDGIIYDEFHYLGEKGRGTVWEEAVMNTPKNIKQMMLSATASNADEVAGWIQKINPNIKVKLINVPENERHVPLRHYVFGSTKSGNYTLVPTQEHRINIKNISEGKLSDRQKLAYDDLEEFLEQNTKDENPVKFLYKITGGQDFIKADTVVKKLISIGMQKQKAEEIALVLADPKKTEYVRNPKLKFDSKPNITELINIIDKNNMTPALVYIFSKKGCNMAFENAIEYNGTLLSAEESRRVLDYIQNAKKKGIYLGANFNDTMLKGLLSGYAVHHAGMLPAYKSLVEDLAREGLVKVCFATETMIAGINMPFKTSVFTSFDKPTEVSKHTPISNAIFTQGAGRAGRRGKDLVGNVIVIPKSGFDYSGAYLELAQTNDTTLQSQYALSYNTLLSENMLNSFETIIPKTFAYHQNPDIQDTIVENAKNMRDMLLEQGYIEKDENGKYKILERGKMAVGMYGINEILMTEILTDPKYTDGLYPEDLIALMAMFADIKDDDPKENLNKEYYILDSKLDAAKKLAREINHAQEKRGIENPIKMSTNLIPAIYEFACCKDEDSVKVWKKTLNDLRNQKLISHEGDYLRVINSTIDLLRIMSESAKDPDLARRAQEAIRMLSSKSPVVDILSYELST